MTPAERQRRYRNRRRAAQVQAAGKPDTTPQSADGFLAKRLSEACDLRPEAIGTPGEPPAPCIDALHALYRETDNPLWAWRAFLECNPLEPFPAWLWTYLAEVAIKINYLRKDEKTPPEAALRKVPTALMLARKGRNAFKLVRDDEEACRFTDWFEDMVARKRVSRKSLIMDKKRHGRTPSQARYEIERARRLWEAQKPVKPKDKTSW